VRELGRSCSSSRTPRCATILKSRSPRLDELVALACDTRGVLGGAPDRGGFALLPSSRSGERPEMIRRAGANSRERTAAGLRSRPFGSNRPPLPFIVLQKTGRRPTRMSNTRRNGALPLLADLLVFSHLRWSFVFKRPQHLMTRVSRASVESFFFEEPLQDVRAPAWKCAEEEDRLPRRRSAPSTRDRSGGGAGHAARVGECRWSTTTICGGSPAGITPQWRCRFAASRAPQRRLRLHGRAVAVLRVAPRLLERDAGTARPRRCRLHGRVTRSTKRNAPSTTMCTAVPSSVDVAHFAKARQPQPDPADQAAFRIPASASSACSHERLDVALLRGLLPKLRPEWQIVSLDRWRRSTRLRCRRRATSITSARRHTASCPPTWPDGTSHFCSLARNDSTRYISPPRRPNTWRRKGPRFPRRSAT